MSTLAPNAQEAAQQKGHKAELAAGMSRCEFDDARSPKRALVAQHVVAYGPDNLPNVVKERRNLIAEKECCHVEKAR